MTIVQRILLEIRKNLSYFELKDIYSEENYKRFTELAIFLHYVNKVTKGKNLEILNQFISRQLSSITSDDIFRNRYYSVYLLLPYILSRKNKPVPRFEKSIEIVLKAEDLGAELQPHRAMELEYFKQKLGFVHDLKIKESSIVRRNGLYIFDINRDFIYAYTHTLFYVFDFGFCSDLPKELDIRQIKSQVECLIAKAYEQKDIDVILELGINYFSLFRFTDINTSLIYVFEKLLKETHFIEFGWREKKVIDEKYHSFLVLGMLSSLITQLINDRRIIAGRRKKLKSVFENTIFHSLDKRKSPKHPIDVEQMPEFQAWQLIKTFRRKRLDFHKYEKYVQKFGYNQFLQKEIIDALNLNNDRNESDILWEREYSKLNPDRVSKLKLKSEYSDRVTNFREKIK